MIGRYEIEIYNNKVHYQLTITRNITIIRGDSATGKSELIRLLTLYNSNPSSSGITLICDKKCIVLNDENWELFTGSYTDRIFFIDEGNEFLCKKEFADVIKSADNYFVIVSRESFPQLPYSVDEIYGLRESEDSGKYRQAKRFYNEMYKIYGKMPGIVNSPEIIITEDSNSGYEFFNAIFKDKCVSAGGKSNVKNLIVQHLDQQVLAIVDGAAFGSEMQKCMELSFGSREGVSIFAPESFEYLILKSGIIEVPKAVIDETWNYADSVRFFSWEEYYTYYLSDVTRNEISQYSKKKLNEYYKTKGNLERICEILPDDIIGDG